ncbi:hypothetical protein LMG26411_07942 [Cupriavidus numazuensis]|uniref:Uncharacterized protein n=1 Tax=Cupriavidus numazuensis TaxID=221992 RepID=A0ABM8TW91_9BURK|nr:hypothetical protein LMG26411_07942 [Cupriavidus numazuensis]
MAGVAASTPTAIITALTMMRGTEGGNWEVAVATSAARGTFRYDCFFECIFFC